MKFGKLVFFWLTVPVLIYGGHVKVIAHRGASSIAPENTLQSFSKAIDLKADYFELDVWLSSDDSIMVIHDQTVNRTTNGDGNINNLPYSYLKQLDAGSWFNEKFAGEKIPTLYEVLSLAKDNRNKTKVCIHINDIKPMIINKVVELVEQMEMQDQVIIACFELSKLKLSKTLAPNIPVLYLLTKTMTIQDIAQAHEIYADAIGPGIDDTVGQNFIVNANLRRMEIWKWTIDDSVKMKYFIKLGVNGIITNYPQRLLPLVNTTSNTSNGYLSPKDFELDQNYPNPFNIGTIIKYKVPVKCQVKLIVYDSVGKELQNIDEGLLDPGVYIYDFNGRGFSSGRFFYSIYAYSTSNVEQPIYSTTRMMLLIK